MSSNVHHDTNLSGGEIDASDYHAMASVAELLAMLYKENQTSKLKNDERQCTHMEFVYKKTGEVLTQRVVF